VASSRSRSCWNDTIHSQSSASHRSKLPFISFAIYYSVYYIFFVFYTRIDVQAQKVYLDSINTFTTDHVPIMGALLMLVATMVSLRSTSSVDFIEFAAKIRLSYRIQSYVFVEYNAVLPLVLFVNRYYTILYSYCYVSVNLL